ncbi:MAG: YdjY domain-containing protein [Acidobacteriota bacterium]
MRRTAAATGLAALLLPGALAAQGVLRRPGEIEFPATVHARAFDGSLMMSGYHAIVWKSGRAHHAALLEADVSDRDVARALEAIGARPGNNLPMETWEKRHDPGSAAPDKVIAGSPVEVLLRLPGRGELLPLSAILEDPAGRGIALRFGGNVENIPKFQSGCIVCLYSCPGSKVGNARYTVRDYVEGVTRFRVRRAVLPPDGTRIGVVLRLLPG